MTASPYTPAELANLREVAAVAKASDTSLTARLLATIAAVEGERDAVCVRFDELRATVREVLRKDHGRCDDCNNFARLSTKTGQLYCYPCAEVDYEDDELASLMLTPYETALRRLRELTKGHG